MTRNPYTSQVQLEEQGSFLTIRISGVWELDRKAPAFSKLIDGLDSVSRVKRMSLVTEGLEDWDSSLLVFLNHAKAWCEERQVEIDTEGLVPGLRRLLKQTESAVDSRVEARAPAGNPDFPTEVGNYTVACGRDIRRFIDFLGEVVLSTLRLPVNQSRMRVSDCVRAMQDSGPMGLPIVGLISFLVGVTLAFQAADLLQDFGSEFFTPAFVGLAMVREMGPIMTGIVLAGRTGASFASTIGSMKVAEEIDALRTLGVSPIDYLVLPRVIGLSIMTPLMVVYANAMGILGGMLVCKVKLKMPVQTYVQEIFLNITLTDIVSGLLKAAVFGMIIAYSGCMRGMDCETNATGVGRATTSAVVTSLLLLIIANSLFAVIYSIYNI